DGVEGGAADRAVVGVAGGDELVVALRVMGDHQLGPYLPDDAGDVLAQVGRGDDGPVGTAEEAQVGDADLLGGRDLFGAAQLRHAGVVQVAVVAAGVAV